MVGFAIVVQLLRSCVDRRTQSESRTACKAGCHGVLVVIACQLTIGNAKLFGFLVSSAVAALVGTLRINGNNYMKTFVTAIAAVIIGSASISSVLAGTATDALSACLADNTTGKDRKEMARWVFVGMASHPEITTLSNVTQASRDDLDKAMATIVTRLLTESCLTQARSAMEKDGGTAFQVAFGFVGKLAMQELMSNPKVNAAFSNFAKHIDQKKVNSAFSK